MSWLRLHQRTTLICGLTLLLPAVLYLSAFFGLWAVRNDAQAEIERLQPRIARLRGLTSYEEQLRDAAVAVESQLVNIVYPATQDQPSIAAGLQTSVRDIFTGAGLSVSNSQVLPVRERGKFDYIGIKLTVSGELSALDEALVGIAEFLPLLLVETIDVYPARVSRVRSRRDRDKAATQPQTITASIQLLSLRAAQ